MSGTQSIDKKDATLYTSLPPTAPRKFAGRDISVAYQRACVLSWRENGFNVVSLNTRAEIDILAKIHSDVIFQETASDRPRIVDFLETIAHADADFAGIINADCMLLEKIATPPILDAAQSGLVIAERLNFNPEDGQLTGASCYGFDLILFCRQVIAELGFDDQITIGTPWWDYWLPLAVQQAGGELFIPSAPIMMHLDHPQNWSWKNWLWQGCRAHAGLMAGNASAKRPLPFVKPLERAEVSKEDIVSFSQDAFSWLKNVSTGIPMEDPSAGALVVFLSRIDRAAKELREKHVEQKQLACPSAAAGGSLQQPSVDPEGARTDLDPAVVNRARGADESAPRAVAVVIPSRLATGRDGSPFLIRAVSSARAQVVPGSFLIRFYVGIDEDAEIPLSLRSLADVTFIRSAGRGQAGAINAAAKAAMEQNHEFVALLEDDDCWEPDFLSSALAALDTCDFVSSNQLEIDPSEHCIRINDFPTPSGWIMRAQLWQKIGPFDESLRWHVDNDWLGRLALSDARRIHLVEATAPVSIQDSAQVRPWIANVLTQGGPRSSVRRHLSPRPLVRRTVHPASGMARIAADPSVAQQSQSEYRNLITRYGRIPW
jgi:hypothetical protein